MSILKMTDLDLRQQRLLIREDFNVPLERGVITSDARIKAALPGICLAINAGAKVMLMSHLGRPVEGEPDSALSLAPVAQRLTELLGQPVRLISDWLANQLELQAGEVVLFENVRFERGEANNQPALAQRIAAVCDIFVMDAFGTAHRAQASTYGVAQYAPLACAGPLLIAELAALASVMRQPVRPLLAIVGGSKVSTKLTVLESLLTKVDQLIVGGGIANTFLAATGLQVGKSLYEPALIPQAQRLLQLATDSGASIILPQDVITAAEFSATVAVFSKAVTEVGSNDMILDVGPLTLQHFNKIILNAGTILWNGPVGAFELAPFSGGTRAIAQAIAMSPGYSVAGGGDTLAAIDQFGVEDNIAYISTGGGAFLEFIEDKQLPAVAILEQRAQQLNRGIA